MGEGKQKSKSQVIGEKAVEILRQLFPAEWEVREYTPDFGIDLAVEIFEQYKEGYITTGEHMYFQVKGTEKIKFAKYKIYERDNVEKSYNKGALYKDIDVVKFEIETALLGTVEKMGSAVPVLLTVVDIINKNAYFICLNDYIEKVIIPEHQDYTKQESLTVYLPVDNIIRSNQDTTPIKWYAKRAKLFALFSKANYQRQELNDMKDKNLKKEILHFANIIFRLDAWSASKYFYALKVVQDRLEDFLATGKIKEVEEEIVKLRQGRMDLEEECWETNHDYEKLSLLECLESMQLRTIWDQICNCGFIIEDIAKEWYLPTYMGIVTRE